MIHLVSGELRKRRLQLNGASRLKSVEMKVEFNGDGEISGFKMSMHESTRVRPGQLTGNGS